MHRASEDTRIATENKGNRRNLDIRVPRVRGIGADGEQVGVLTRDEALGMAQEIASTSLLSSSLRMSRYVLTLMPSFDSSSASV